MGVRVPLGVRKPSESRSPRLEGVCGKAKGPFVGDVLRLDGVIGNATEFLEGVAGRLEGVIGKGTAKSPRARFAGDFEGDFDKREGDVGVARIEADEGDFGEEDAKRRVRFEGCFATGKAGREDIGISGTSRVSL